jgi:molybdopterin-guanine dinucleotide biosynthesis protein A
MGKDKALLAIDGQLLWERQYALLAKLGNVTERFLSVRPDQTWLPEDVKRVTDPKPDCGPLGGVVAALKSCANDHLAVLAVDLPLIPASWFRYLGELLAHGVGVIGRHSGGLYEPLAAIYPRQLLTLAEADLRAGKLALQSVVEGAVRSGLMRVREIEPAQAGWFQNWNSPADVRLSLQQEP